MLAEKVFPQLAFTPEELEQKYPKRTLPAEAMVTRVAPSPTGFMHIGGLYAALISEMLAHQSGGVFYLRIEDTDKKREVEGARELIVSSFHDFEIAVDEGATVAGEEKGGYGPYTQSARAALYDVYVYTLLQDGMAYLCFCSPEELTAMRTEQEALKTRPGYYGSWAKCRSLSEAEALQQINAGKSYVIRFKSPGDFEKKIVINDLVKGRLEMSENDQDIVLRKEGGLPTYHLAHVVDDHLMRTTHVTRADEWVASLPLHVQLFTVFGWELPQYGHISPIQKMDGSSKRKLSKRKDPEASVEYYDQQGYPKQAVIEYMLTLANSNYEQWRLEHADSSPHTFPISLDKISKSGALFDETKLTSISQEVISSYSPAETFAQAVAWCKKFDQPLAAALEGNTDLALQIFTIERDEKQGRKDITKWSDLRPAIGYFFDPIFETIAIDWEVGLAGVVRGDAPALVNSFLEHYDPQDTKEQWFEKLKMVAKDHGYADNVKEYKNAPNAFKGHVGDIAKLFRVALVGKNQSPDLSEVMRVMGNERVIKRLHCIPV